MKKILLVLLLSAFGILAQAQTIDSTKCGYVVRIQPVKVKYSDTTEAVFLNAVVVGDDMVSSGTFYFRLLDSNCNRMTHGNVIIQGENYINWSGSSEEAYKFISDNIGVQLKEE